MLSHPYRRLVLVLLVLTARPLAAQYGASSSLEGTVRTAEGSLVARALVTMTGTSTGTSYQATTSTLGAFTLNLVRAGEYEIRVEALGYRPLLARGLSFGTGDHRILALTLTPAPPPVIDVDTLILSPSASTLARPEGVRFGRTLIDALPHRSDDVASLASLSSAYDGSMGTRGLPGDLTVILADGVPFFRAPHPGTLAETRPSGIFPRRTLSGLSPLQATPDIERAGGIGGGVIALATQGTPNDGRFALDGAFGSDATWSSSVLAFDAPSHRSYQAGMGGAFDVTPGISQAAIAGETVHDETPLTPRVSAAVGSELAGIDANLLGSVLEPSVERYTRHSGMARFDSQRGSTSAAFLRAAGSVTRRDFLRSATLSLDAPASLDEESREMSLAVGVVNQYSSKLALELRGGFSFSSRDFGGTGDDPLPAGNLVDSGTFLGQAAGTEGTSSRNDFVFTPVLRYALSEGQTLKAGTDIRVSSHTMAQSRAPMGEFFYSDPAALLAGRGLALSTSATEESFGTKEFGVFFQHESVPAPGLELKFGGRYDHERLNVDAAPGLDWFLASGLRNDDFSTGLNKLGFIGSLAWDAGSGDTRLFVIGSRNNGNMDTRALYEVAATATATRYAGSSLNWPTADVSALAAELPELTLLNPDTRAPQTTDISLGATQRLTSTTTVAVRGSMRRTDFLLRRRNLNLHAVDPAVDTDGRGILGTLVQDGSLVSATGDDARRFEEFGAVWALDPDGWSEYRGLTATLDHSSGPVDLLGSYTYSETTDNWIGARDGSPEARLSPELPVTQNSALWDEGTSDFDVRHRVAAALRMTLGPAMMSAVYRFRSGLPITPRYRAGVDANGDGTTRNDVAFVPDLAQLATLMDAWPCLEGQAGGFAHRNSCRGDDRHSVDARVEVSVGSLSGRSASLVIDGFNLIESSGGVVDDALWLIDPSGSITTSPDGSTVSLPTVLNQEFGAIRYPSSPGRLVRIGFRIGG